jgi:hypothetical protein
VKLGLALGLGLLFVAGLLVGLLLREVMIRVLLFALGGIFVAIREYLNSSLMFSCWYEKRCLASLKGTTKYIYHFDDQPEEVFDLSDDPGERRNLADSLAPEELEEQRAELLKWRAGVHSKYGTRPAG